MMEETEFEGTWWKPGEPDKATGGKVVYSPEDGIGLSTYTSFGEGAGNLNLERSDFDTLYGQTTDGHHVTLIDCVTVSPSFKQKSSGQVAPLDTKWRYLFSGHLFEGEDDVEFDKVRITDPLLEYWVETSGVGMPEEMMDPSWGSGDPFTVSYNFPDPLTADIGDSELKLSVHTNFSTGRTSGAEIKETHYFQVTPHEGRICVEDAIDKAGLLQDFLTIALGNKTRPSSITGIIETESDREKNKEIEIYYDSVYDFEVADSVHPNEKNFILSDVSGRFESMMKTWFEKADVLENTYNLYFGLIYNDSMYINMQILALTQALEAYFRDRMGDMYLPEEEYEEFSEHMEKSIPDGLPEGFVAHIKNSTLKHGNEYSLAKKIVKILEEYEEVFEEIGLVSENKIRDVVNTRNYYTHYDEEIEAATDSREVVNQINVLRLVVEGVLLSEIGLPSDKISENLERKYSQRMM